MSVELPKKHGRGGQSALRFARLRLEKRHNYVTKVAEMAAQVFITNDKVNVVGLVVAGSAEFKTVLVEAERFDQRLAAKVIGVYDVSYGGENGLNQVSLSCAGTLWVPWGGVGGLFVGRVVKLAIPRRCTSISFCRVDRDPLHPCMLWGDACCSNRVPSLSSSKGPG